MPVLRVRTEDGEREFPFTPGTSLRDILAAGCLQVRSGCGGVGSCGLCLVRIEPGEVNDYTPASRLRCKVISGGDARGICGSGLVDIIATLRNTGIIDSAGKFIRDVKSKGISSVFRAKGAPLKA